MDLRNDFETCAIYNMNNVKLYRSRSIHHEEYEVFRRASPTAILKTVRNS